MPTVSVVIPTYNRQDVLPRAIDSVLQQTYSDFEIIVVNDGSRQDIESMVTSYDDERLSLKEHDENKGLAEARNTGIRASHGRYVGQLDDDDVWKPEKLEKQIRLFESLGAEYGMVYSGREIIADGQMRSYQPEEEGEIYETLLRDNVIPSETPIIRRECFRKVGLYDTDFEFCIDWDMSLRIAREYKIAKVDEALAICYRERSDRLSADRERQYNGHKRILEKYSEDLFRDPVALSRMYEKLGFDTLYMDYDTSKEYFKQAALANKRDFSAVIYYVLTRLPHRFRGIVYFLRYSVPF